MKKDGQKEKPARRQSSVEDSRKNRGSVSPAHWQGEPLPDNSNKSTQEIGFDKRGAGSARQYGRAGDYGQANNEQESRPPRGPKQPDDELLNDVLDVFRQSGLNATDVEVSVNKGVVHLSGIVEDQADKYAFERLAISCRGAVAVENQLEQRSALSDAADT